MHSLPCQVARYVSWNEFVHQMLARGEVEELIVRPDLDIVTIILHEGAVVKGKKVLCVDVSFGLLRMSNCYIVCGNGTHGRDTWRMVTEHLLF